MSEISEHFATIHDLIHQMEHAIQSAHASGANSGSSPDYNFTTIAAEAGRIGGLCSAMVPLCQSLQSAAWRAQREVIEGLREDAKRKGKAS